MALINCPECKAEISNQAKSCPKCAYPINISPVNVKVAEVQYTKKKYKLHRTIALTMFYLGLFGIPLIWVLRENGYKDSFFTTILVYLFMALPFSIAYLLIIRILVWWNHR